MKKLVSWNLNGIRAVAKKGLIDIIYEINADVFCFQETKAQDDQVQEVLKDLEDYHIYINSAKKKGYSGTAILTKEKPTNVEYGLGINEHDDEGRLITVEFDTHYLLTTYVPNSQNGLARIDYRQRWDAALLDHMCRLKESKPVILCGDLNVAHHPIDLKNPKSNFNKTAGYTEREIAGMDNFLINGFTDTYRHFYPSEIKYSWWSYRFNSRAKNVGWRIDYFLASDGLIDKVENAFILNEVSGSDHCPVGVLLK